MHLVCRFRKGHSLDKDTGEVYSKFVVQRPTAFDSRRHRRRRDWRLLLILSVLGEQEPRNHIIAYTKI